MSVMGLILGGSIIMTIFMYVVMMILLSVKAVKGNMKSDSRGIKTLKFQEWNSAWKKYVI